MSKTNYQILEENRKAVLKFAKETADKPESYFAPSTEEEGRNEAKRLFNAGNLSAAIKKLDEIKDNRLGIVWHESDPNLVNGTSVLVRDARGVTTDEARLKLDAPEKYAMQILNQTRGAYALIDTSNLSLEEKQEAKEKLTYIARKAMDNIDSLGSNTIRDYNTQMLHVLKNSKIDNAGEKLKFASEVASLKDEHRHIVTLTTAFGADNKPRTVYEAEIMLSELTGEQATQYSEISHSKPDQDCGVEWFDNMDKYKQDLLRPVVSKWDYSNKVIPAQLIGEVPGIRNAYQKVTAISNENPNPKILSQTLHAGTPTTKIKNVSKEAKQAIADENLRQLQSFLPPGESLNLNILTSKTPFNVRGEDFVFDQLKNTKTKNVTVSASPINRWRLLGGGGRNTKQFERNLSSVGKGLENDAKLKNVSKYLQKGKSRFGNFLETVTRGAYETTQTKAKKELQALSQSNPSLTKDLQAATSARSLVDSSTLFANSENANLELTAKMAIVRNSVKSEDGKLHSIVGSEVARQYPNDVNFCKSGKDRTGYVQANETREAVAAHLGVDPQSEFGKKNFRAQLAGGHTQEMAGVQGGTIGCHSVKTNPEFGFRKSDNMANGILDQKSSHFNSSIKTVKKDPKKVTDKFEEDFAASKTVAPDVAKKQEAEVEKRQSIAMEKATNIRASLDSEKLISGNQAPPPHVTPKKGSHDHER